MSPKYFSTSRWSDWVPVSRKVLLTYFIYSSTLKMKITGTAETSVIYLSTRLLGVIFRKTLVIIFITMRNSDLRPLMFKYSCDSSANVLVIRVRILVGAEVTLCRLFRSAVGSTQPPIHCVREVKKPEPEADHLHASSAEINNAWSCASITRYVSLVWFLIKLTDKFTFVTLWAK